jgi:tetratricopeptide (TPR) repeat protein
MTTNRRFRISFSLAGEKRDFVSKVADILAGRFGEDKILYDKYHEAEFANWKLGLLLQELYHDQSDLIVVVACPDYSNKDWCGLEWVAIHAMLMSGKDREIMLCRFAHAKLQGLNENAGCVELDDKTAEQTATLILERLALNEGKLKNHYTANALTTTRAASTSTPNNLPRLDSFFGRTEELKQIAEALDPESRTWGALIDGPGGMGKTSLAVRAAYDCPPGQFQRIIFLSVKDRELDDDGERQLGAFILPGFLEMLNELARELGQPEINKAAETDRIRLILAALAPAQALLILDNLESLTKDDRDQLFTFVKRLPQGCKAILTSRRRIGSSADVLILEKLDQKSALQALAEIAKHNPLLAKTTRAGRISLYQQTDGNPLLLRWTAGQLGRGSCRTIADALAFIRSCPPGNDPLEFVFGDLANEFTLEETQVLVALTYFTLPANVEHIATVADLDEVPAETALRTLANRSLVIPDQEERAFNLVPIVADFMRRKRSDVVAETGNRLEKHAYALIVENGYHNHDRFPALETAWPTLAPALPLFVSGPNARLQTICSALDYFLDFTGRWDEQLSLNQHAEVKAVTTGDNNNAGWRAFQSGWVSHLRQQADAVLACAARAERHWQNGLSGDYERVSAIHLRGIGHQLRSDYPAAIAAFREALDLLPVSSAESIAAAGILNALANAETKSGDLDGAERDYHEALRVARIVDPEEGVSIYTGNLAELALTRGNWLEAEVFAREALCLAENVGRLELIASDSRRIAHALKRQGRVAEALPYARRAVDIYVQLGSAAGIKEASETLDECESSARLDSPL